ncbi:MAG TPA: PKD domain-containing protein [Thermoanaerobaculia bacterium]|nr:PKD domain-containing protein [Thermoanaerobaculia bacterium]
MHRIAVTLLLVLLTSFAARATTIVLPTDEQLIDKSPVIVSGTVLSTMPVDRGGMIWTDTRVAVTRAIKGQSEATITIHELGGIQGDRITKIFGSPEFREGERVLLFLEPAPRGGYRVMDLFVGKFGEGKALNGRRVWLRDDSHEEVALLDADLRPANPTNIQRDAAGFETFVTERLAGRAAKKTYGIVNPVLQSEDGSGRIKSDFTLISEPNIYRWFHFDQNQTVPWHHVGTQPGYSGNGVSELQTAMAVWTGYSEAKIRYTYAGALSGGGNPNEVYFNDPLNAIAGTWNPNTGGTVGLGGYNGTGASGTFTATFQADLSHTAGVKQAFEITSALLTIQNGVSPSASISSATLAEIIAHEFGHTLGFGHSASNVALMFASVTGLGPSLRDDDRLAARWLYPNGGGTTTPTAPAAPSNLTATPSGSNADLTWTDNANNETSQSIHLAQGNGSFTNIGSVGANATSVRISSLAAGSYRVYVVASNSAGNSPQSNTATFIIASPPTAAFTMTPTSGNAAETNFVFYDESFGSITSRLWQFGDGATSTSSVATHTYAASGQYTITLTVSGPGGTSSTSKVVTISGPLNPQFVWSPTVPLPNQTAQFTDQSGGAPTSWLWNFGDGTNSTLQNPPKQYGSQGTYTVTLTVYRNGNSASTSRPITVANSTPATQPPVAAFDMSSSVSLGDNVAFTDRSTGAPVSWEWTFGDGGTSSVQSPTHVYAAPGTYMVTLVAANSAGTSSLSKQITVTSITPYRGLISAAAQTNGIGGTSWRTELSLLNAGLEGTTVTMRFLPSPVEKTIEKTIYLTPRQTVTYSNTLLEAFDLTTGAGAVTIDASSAGSSAQLRVTSRTFTTGAIGTYGQSVPEVQAEQLAKTLYITGIQSSSAYRTNIGLVNRAEAEITAALTLYSQTGGTIATKNVTLPATSFQQSAVWALFPEVQGASHDALTLKIATNAADAVSAYASVVDNSSQDPIYVQASAAPFGDSLTIPVVGRAPGANQTFWRSDVTLFNPNDDDLSITLGYGNATRTILLDGHDTEVLADLLSLFELTSGTGSLFVSWSGQNGPVVTSRTYTTAESGGTYGQSIDPMTSLKSSMFVPGLRNDGSFRSNVGFVNGGGESETFAVIVLSPSGTELARNTLTLAANSMVQHSVSSLFPNVNSSSFTLFMEGDANARLFAYGSMVDNASGDPVFFAGQ